MHRYIADGRLDVIRRGRSVYLTRESVERLHEELTSRREPLPELSEADRAAIWEQVRAMQALTPTQLTALGATLAEIRLAHATQIAEERSRATQPQGRGRK